MKRAAVIPNSRKNLRVAAIAGSAVIGMLGLAYASVPLYSMFCAATGFGGTTQRAVAAPEAPTGKFITIRFDANTAASLGWNFHPAQPVMKVRIGEQNLAHYSATNTSAKTLTGTASFNVTPAEAGAYFNKIECFCFTEQTLKPGEPADLPGLIEHVTCSGLIIPVLSLVFEEQAYRLLRRDSRADQIAAFLLNRRQQG